MTEREQQLIDAINDAKTDEEKTRAFREAFSECDPERYPLYIRLITEHSGSGDMNKAK